MMTKNRTVRVLGRLQELVQLFVNHSFDQTIRFYYVEVEKDESIVSIFYWSASVWNEAQKQLFEIVSSELGISLKYEDIKASGDVSIYPRHRRITRSNRGFFKFSRSLDAYDRVWVRGSIVEQLKSLPELEGWQIIV